MTGVRLPHRAPLLFQKIGLRRSLVLLASRRWHRQRAHPHHSSRWFGRRRYCRQGRSRHPLLTSGRPLWRTTPPMKDLMSLHDEKEDDSTTPPRAAQRAGSFLEALCKARVHSATGRGEGERWGVSTALHKQRPSRDQQAVITLRVEQCTPLPHCR
eukprot:scaffold49326_cov29-Tisochrysis_lutea.AAC.5